MLPVALVPTLAFRRSHSALVRSALAYSAVAGIIARTTPWRRTMQRALERDTWCRTHTIAIAACILVAACGGGPITGHEIVQNRVIVAPGTTVQVTVKCPAGKKV